MQTKKSPISEPRLRFGRQEHLKRRAEITRVFKKGRAVSCSGARLFFLANGLTYNRIVITFVRKYGNAVRRNRARRVSREAYRLMKSSLPAGYDLVLLLYPRVESEQNAGETPGPAKPKHPGLAESTGQLKTLFKKAGIR